MTARSADFEEGGDTATLPPLLGVAYALVL